MLKDFIKFFILSRIGIYIFALAAFIVFTNRISPSLYQIFIEEWWRWDSVHFINIAQYGYAFFLGDERFNIVFLPLFPLLISIVSKFGFHPVIAGLLISTVFSIIAVIFFYKLVKLDYPETVAERTVLYLAIFPTAYFLSTVYTESLFLALSISCFYYSRKSNWFLAGVLGFLAALTRNFGIIIFIALMAEYFYQIGFKWRKIKLNVFFIFLILAGFGVYLLINMQIFGNPWQFIDFQKSHWYKYPSFPWNGLKPAYDVLTFRSPELKITGIMEIIFVFLGFISSIFAFRIRLSYGIYAFFSMIFITSTSFWLSIPRYFLSIFPIFIVFALWGKKHMFNQVYIFLSTLFLGLFATMFVLGKWAF